ncbi:MAG: HAD-IA family hydrolase [Acidimicrobiales bacterium]
MRQVELRAVVFDVDGTLVDSERDGHRVAFNRAFAAAGLVDRWDVETYGELLEITGGERRLRHYLLQSGSSLPKPVDPAEIDALVTELHRAKTRFFAEMVKASSIPARPGAVRLLQELGTEDVAVGVATTGSSAWVRPLLDQLFGSHRFAAVVTGEDVVRSKPDPEAYLLALRRLGTEPGAALAVEDSGPGLASAVRAGLACVVVANSYTDRHEVSEASVLLDGFGEPHAPAAVLTDRYETMRCGVLDVASLRRLLDRVGSADDSP